MRTITALFLFSYLASAESLSFGVKGGGVLTNPAERVDRSDRYVVGGFVEFAIHGRFAVEGDALYSRFGSSSSSLGARGNTWEFPVLGKYYFSERRAPVAPFVAAGVNIGKTWLENNRSSGRGIGSVFTSSSSDPSIGAAVSGGAAFKTWRLTLAPEVRYTRWGGNNYPVTNPNQLQVLLGIRF